MAVYFRPEQRAILACNFDMARVPPEFDKVRRVIVVSLIDFNHKHGNEFGRCVVVPITTRVPDTEGPQDVLIPAGRYWSVPENSWAICSAVSTVSHKRLDLCFRNGKRARSESINAADWALICDGLKAVLGIV